MLLTHDEVVAAVPQAERAQAVSGARPDEVLSRVADWMCGMGDAAGFDTAELLDAPCACCATPLDPATAPPRRAAGTDPVLPQAAIR
ncbi:hypothetical protein [Actinacidiphila sp. bgisy167]|uniref:hypothetical protein n=1 Tax=Actinacidiphila sp. bgisy167 TaxID=3413797 RepID=UPI003D75994B